jgi:molecular chaperone GrpE
MTGDQGDYIPENTNGADDDAPDELARLTNENAELKDRMLRALADAENTRRRSEREREENRQYAVTSFARDMLNVADNLNRALQSIPEDARAQATPQIKAVLDGVEATERQLLAALERHGVRRIETAGAKFDPHLHQAIAEVASEGRPAGTIVNVVQTGYVIADRLLRPAMVTVAARDAAESASPAGDSMPGGTLDTKA